MNYNKKSDLRDAECSKEQSETIICGNMLGTNIIHVFYKESGTDRDFYWENILTKLTHMILFLLSITGVRMREDSCNGKS